MHLTGERFDSFVWLPAADESVTVVYSHACNLVLICPQATQFGPMLARAEIESPRSKMMWNLAICFVCWEIREIWHPILSETQIVTALVNMQYLMKRFSIVRSWRPSWSPLIPPEVLLRDSSIPFWNSCFAGAFEGAWCKILDGRQGIQWSHGGHGGTEEINPHGDTGTKLYQNYTNYKHLQTSTNLIRNSMESHC